MRHLPCSAWSWSIELGAGAGLARAATPALAPGDQAGVVVGQVGAVAIGELEDRLAGGDRVAAARAALSRHPLAMLDVPVHLAAAPGDIGRIADERGPVRNRRYRFYGR